MVYVANANTVTATSGLRKIGEKCRSPSDRFVHFLTVPNINQSRSKIRFSPYPVRINAKDKTAVLVFAAEEWICETSVFSIKSRAVELRRLGRREIKSSNQITNGIMNEQTSSIYTSFQCEFHLKVKFTPPLCFSHYVWSIIDFSYKICRQFWSQLS